MKKNVRAFAKALEHLPEEIVLDLLFASRHVLAAHGHRRPPEVLALLCARCSEPCTDSYMVKDGVWSAAGRDPTSSGGADVLHLRCLETALGRQLRVEDFTDAPTNAEILFAFERGNRAGHVQDLRADIRKASALVVLERHGP